MSLTRSASGQTCPHLLHSSAGKSRTATPASSSARYVPRRDMTAPQSSQSFISPPALMGRTLPPFLMAHRAAIATIDYADFVSHAVLAFAGAGASTRRLV